MASIVIPTYKERECLEVLIPEILSYLSSKENEVIIVNDESGDGTFEWISNNLKELPVLVLNRPKRDGLASAVIEGLRFCKYNDIIVMDADGQHPPRFLPEMIEALKDHDLVVGTRYFMLESGVPGFSTPRILGSIVCNLLAWPLTGLRDSTSGFFGIRRSEAPTLFGWIDPSCFKIGFEYFTRMKKNRQEVPYVFEHRYFGETKMSTRQVSLYFKQLWEAYSRKFDLVRMSKFFVVGALGVAVNYSVLIPLVEVFSVDYRIANFAAISCAALFNFKLNASWTFRNSRVVSNSLSSTTSSTRINLAKRILRFLKLSNSSEVFKT